MEFASRDRLVLAVEGLQGENGSEDFILDDLGVVGTWLDERRLVPQTVGGEFALRQR